MPEYGFYSQRMCNNLMNEFTGERCALEEGHAGRCRSKEVSMVPEPVQPVRGHGPYIDRLLQAAMSPGFTRSYTLIPLSRKGARNDNPNRMGG